MKKTVKIKGMTCHSCEMLIKDAVEELDGVTQCQVSAAKGEAIVSFDENKTRIETIKQTIKKEGYEIQ